MKKSSIAIALLLCSSVQAQYTVIIGKNDNVSFVSKTVVTPTPIPEPPVVPVKPTEPEDPNKNNTSCKSLLDKTPSLTSGVYSIKSGGSEIAAYCDMSGGGWTLVASGIRNNANGWATSGSLNLTPNPSISVGFKFADSVINNIQKNVYKTVTTGRYAYTRYFAGSCTYQHTSSAKGACLISYANEGLSAGVKAGAVYNEATGLSDYNQATGLLYVITGYSGSIAIHGWGMGNGVNSGYNGTGIAGDGGNIQIWVK
jgi:hypothetical protein